MISPRLPKNRRFNYEPILYDPEKEERERRRIRFRRSAPRRGARKRSLPGLLFLLAILIYVIYFLSKLHR